MPGGVHRRRKPPARLPSAELIRVVGRILGAEVEKHPNPREIDHLWIRIQADGEVVLSINTSSKRNRLAGFDARIRVGVIRGEWEVLPPSGTWVCASNDYAELESQTNVFFEHYEREPLENLLLDRCRRACLVEVWGAPFRRQVSGVHQIHCRWASCAVPESLHGRDGAVKFYFQAGQVTEHFLFKFCGQP
ncbi:MAG: hypothetical protein IAE94_04915 [Chthoniobacterales bacterium]|nr:hypothetical protein [Chthoniobacterales bacterium]